MDKMFMCHINGNVASFSQGVQIIFKFNLLSNCDDTNIIIFHIIPKIQNKRNNQNYQKLWDANLWSEAKSFQFQGTYFKKWSQILRKLH